MKKIEEIIEELRKWAAEGKGRAIAVAALETGGDCCGNISGIGKDVIGAISCILKNAEDCGIPPQVIMSCYEDLKEGIKIGGGNERYS